MSAPFRRRSALHSWELHFGPNMTPMVDVVMVILIFFMATATFAGSEWFLRTALPKPGTERPPPEAAGDPLKLPPARFELSLTRAGDRTAATIPGIAGDTLADLSQRLTSLAGGAGDDIILVIRAAPDVPYADVVRAHDAAAAAGIARVGLMDAPPSGP